jgi:hypothetical protein
MMRSMRGRRRGSGRLAPHEGLAAAPDPGPGANRACRVRIARLPARPGGASFGGKSNVFEACARHTECLYFANSQQ